MDLFASGQWILAQLAWEQLDLCDKAKELSIFELGKSNVAIDILLQETCTSLFSSQYKWLNHIGSGDYSMSEIDLFVIKQAQDRSWETQGKRYSNF